VILASNQESALCSKKLSSTGKLSDFLVVAGCSSSCYFVVPFIE